MRISALVAILSAASAFAVPLISKTSSSTNAIAIRGIDDELHGIHEDLHEAKDRIHFHFRAIAHDLDHLGDHIHDHLHNIKYEIKHEIREWRYEVESHVRAYINWISGQWHEFHDDFEEFKDYLEDALEDSLDHIVTDITYDITHFWYHNIVYLWSHLEYLADDVKYTLSWKLRNFITLVAQENGWIFAPESDDCGYLLVEFEYLVSLNLNWANIGRYQTEILEIHSLVYNSQYVDYFN
ncbi:hypothetical protein FRC03_002891 [Tulasnella sp. 419]|nr:hypothetical protein FRC03_002891 [Tulasnella sp. 419]